MGIPKPVSARLLFVVSGIIFLGFISTAHGQKFQYSKGWMPGGKRSGMLENFLSADEPIPAHPAETEGVTSLANDQPTPSTDDDLLAPTASASLGKRYPFHYYRIGKRGDLVPARYRAPGLARAMKLLPRLGVSTSSRRLY
ncbi:hypothetical protein RvY_10344 [Ramazzottius varieornatus]|uniref:Uncharacterized protein n=1 Tax=Ramazzottius varieornatus TaxID=947166 RepID=A0A1D1VEJ1_RAMVA|nr:hypothetical protein RvY_10344 [Ramazzottius varieornatus]